MSIDVPLPMELDIPVPYWPVIYPRARPEAAQAVQFWLTPRAEAELAEADPEAGQ